MKSVFVILVFIFVLSEAMADQIESSADPNGQNQTHVYQKNLGSNVKFSWDYDSVTIGCSACDKACSNCTHRYDLNITPATKFIQCGDEQFGVDWQWPKIIVTGGCKGTVEYVYSFRFRGVRTKDGVIVFQGETSDKEVLIPFIFGEADVRFEVATKRGEAVSEYATSLTEGMVDGVSKPWIVRAGISSATDFVISD